MRLILIEDNDRLADSIRLALEADGFAVDRFDTLAKARSALASASYDLILLDRGMPDGEGLGLIAALRRKKSITPMLVITARDELGDRVHGLDSGADDYLVKPFATAELSARCRALLRRPGAVLGSVLEVGNVSMVTAEKLGQGQTLDFVFLSLGSMALLGYETGSDSSLMGQMALELDRQIQSTLEMLNKVPGKNNYNLIFAAAHGAPPEPEPATRSQKAIAGESLAHAVAKALSEWIDKGPVKNAYVDQYVYPFLYLNLETLHKQNTPIRGARKLAGETALRVPGVAGYYTADGDCSHTSFRAPR